MKYTIISITFALLGLTVCVLPFTISHHSTHTVTLIPSNNIQNPQYTLREYITALQKNRAPEHACIIDNTNSIAALTGIKTSLIPPTTPITLFSRGYAKKKNPANEMPRIGGGVYSDLHYRFHSAIHTPSVLFDYPDQRKHFNLGQQLDYNCLQFVYNEIVTQSPDNNIILFGDCRGALVALQLAAQEQYTNITTMILISPLTSARDMINQISYNYLWMLGSYGPPVLDTFFSWYFPQYNPNDAVISHAIKSIRKKKIFIATRYHDTLAPYATVRLLAETLAEKNDVFLFATHDNSAPHSKLYLADDFIKTINAFYRRYNFPHCMDYATAGEEMLQNSAILFQATH